MARDRNELSGLWAAFLRARLPQTRPQAAAVSMAGDADSSDAAYSDHSAMMSAEPASGQAPQDADT